MALTLLVFVLLSIAIGEGNSVPCDASAELPFRNVSLAWQERVADLEARLTLAEAIVQLSRGGGGPNGGPAPAIDRLGIRPFQWDSECLRGVVQAGNATAFPQAIGLAATFDVATMYAVARATGLEARAKYNGNVARGLYGDHTGINCFSPVINIARHPLWGRVQETYGEDPFLSGRLAEYFVKGLQGNHSRYILASAGCKHYVAHSGPEDIPSFRFSFDAKVTEKDLHMTYLPAFKACVDAGAYSIMCSYNSINGIPSCGNHHTLTEILRTTWNFTGFVVSDQGAVELIIFGHKYTKTMTEAAAVSLKAGVNLDLPVNMKNNAFSFLGEAVSQGLVTEALIRKRLRPLLYTRMRLGEFDPPTMNPYSKLAAKDFVQSSQHVQLAVDSAIKSFVLLKNTDGFLPLREASLSLGIIGPMAYAMDQLYGDYSPDRMPQHEYGILKQLAAAATKMYTTRGCTDGPWCFSYNESGVRAVLAAKPDVVILTLGTGQAVETEGLDRQSLALPHQQARLLGDVIAQSSAPIILLVFSATPVDIRAADASGRVRAIVWCGFPAQAAGMAVRHAVFPDPRLSRASIGGRLPFTWYASEDQLPGRTDYLMHNQTYRYYPVARSPPLYPFGYGLSFAVFRYETFNVTSGVPASVGKSIQFRTQLRNMGKVRADEVVQLYGSWMNVSGMPKIQLMGFKRLTLSPGAAESIQFMVAPFQCAIWVDGHGLIQKPVQMTFYVGGQQPNQKKHAPSNLLQLRLKIVK